MKPTKNKSDFKHYYDVIVTFDKVDMLHIVNNAVYFNYFEQARIKYAKDIGILPERGISLDGTTFYMVRNEINYLKAALFEDRLRVYTRISFIKKSSFGFEHIIENIDTGIIIAEGAGVLAHVDPIQKKSIPLPDEFYEKVLSYELKVEILKS
ncbi:acyl-CoA thioesterase [Stygiobacter electus]|jgi:acyl-CoA thioester hydrolase|uniref:Thioesterase family protein n=1 Tax=Stygiobacter electus TaxID=3032292 RepID=A0AAE3P4R4_9BACT|nr:thioesterase family protein [Stygiobacter electus]MDF1613298.1 thioesterase family protein [Stygiobacter electus]